VLAKVCISFFGEALATDIAHAVPTQTNELVAAFRFDEA
jgi:hypothetical protein